MDTTLQNSLGNISRAWETVTADANRYIGLEAAAQVLGLAPESLRVYVHNGRIDLKPKRVSGRLLFRVGDLRDHLHKKHIQAAEADLQRLARIGRSYVSWTLP